MKFMWELNGKPEVTVSFTAFSKGSFVQKIIMLYVGGLFSCLFKHS